MAHHRRGTFLAARGNRFPSFSLNDAQTMSRRRPTCRFDTNVPNRCVGFLPILYGDEQYTTAVFLLRMALVGADFRSRQPK